MHDEERHAERDQREESGHHERGVEAPPLGEQTAQLADEDGGHVDGAPLHGLEGAREAPGLAVLDHERIHHQ